MHADPASTAAQEAFKAARKAVRAAQAAQKAAADRAAARDALIGVLGDMGLPVRVIAENVGLSKTLVASILAARKK